MKFVITSWICIPLLISNRIFFLIYAPYSSKYNLINVVYIFVCRLHLVTQTDTSNGVVCQGIVIFLLTLPRCCLGCRNAGTDYRQTTNKIECVFLPNFYSILLVKVSSSNDQPLWKGYSRSFTIIWLCHFLVINSYMGTSDMIPRYRDSARMLVQIFSVPYVCENKLFFIFK